ncbi:MAG: hypothetical protein CSA13_00185 [Clostridiales bacterium]|nr:MAG: hypothetical protein CSA13_00185 [Clostridiales bacterium]
MNPNASTSYLLPSLAYIFVIVVVVALAYLTTVVVAKLYGGRYSANNIKIVERLNISNDKSLWLIELAEKHYFIAVDKNGIYKIDEIDGDKLTFIEQSEKGKMPFMALLKDKMKRPQNDDE